MNERKMIMKTKGKLIAILLIYLGIAFSCIGFVLYMGISNKDNYVGDRTVTVYNIIVLLGVFFLVLAFGYIVPAIVKFSKGDFGICDEKKMMFALEKHLPDYETLMAGIYSVGIQTEIKQVFGKCSFDGEKLMPDENGTTLQVTKGKCAKFEVYVGITQHYLILSECKQYQHFYKFDDVPDLPEGTAVEIDACIPIQDIGNCFPLAEIQSCVLKKAGMGDVNCSITMKNGSLIKLKLPKNGGAGMPNHARYREAIIARLCAALPQQSV
ncbi:MAG: hypothetical protein K2H52_08140 [Lachnospiraceae bacterium]|nr:hypothetical protein [Lachnospiraceae bacterium]MDE6185863.1 hypothetical protein [Lachnospiraceae bacterium]